jgi:hypothetical protein
MENQTENVQSQNPPVTEKAKSFNQGDVKSFFKKDLLGMIRLFLSEPISGTYSLFANRSNNSYYHSLILILTTAVLYMIIPYLLLGDARSYIPFSFVFKSGLLPVIFMFAVSTVSFIIKSISGKAIFRSELLTGALNSFPLTFILLLVSFIIIFSGRDLNSMAFDPMSAITAGIIYMIIVLYIFLMMINIMQQSLKSSGTKDGFAWYISPVSVIVSFYLTYKVAKMLFE